MKFSVGLNEIKTYLTTRSYDVAQRTVVNAF